MIYLSGTYSQLAPQFRPQFGYMLNVNRQIGQEAEAVAYAWMLDNGAYSRQWDAERWRRRLEQLAPANANCIAAVVPDVIHNAAATGELWAEYAPVVKALGYKAAFVTQDGASVGAIPWQELDALFVGGSNNHKEIESRPLIAEAKRRGLWVHIGRVNSIKRIMAFSEADSVDGTIFRYEATIKRQERILWAIRSVNARAAQQGRLYTPASLARPMP